MIIHTPPLTIQLLKILLGFSIAKQSTLLTQFRLSGWIFVPNSDGSVDELANHIQDYYNDAFGQFMVAKDRIEIRLFLTVFFSFSLQFGQTLVQGQSI